ncbi:alpha-L-rhamnosidase C-terminal domain-containing protein [Pelagicoccus enzymogenes]|uniref:alpha-L-rhamnosidase-related protein n=1 Tax=Pelagicoccus enzymogenes TaxID=2773457 RepID=UPI00280F326C|nr:alpha-L-rhamnosidase C-terminal domain-containing protein [Pelagicoccus enzymogenes]MDQ8200630.1 alpha-L-rhamnosidase C-terminal domain-containing protein [Pelagicoccus enzymogenes]
MERNPRSPLASQFAAKIVFAVIALLFASTQAARANADWTDAQWIWQAEDGPSNTWVAFRKTFDLDAVPEQVIAHIATDTKYWLWVNGELALFEGGLARGPAPGDGYFDEVNLRNHLQPGENTVAILVWYWGKTAKTHESSGQGGLLFSADLGKTKLRSDESWKLTVHPSYDPASEGLHRSNNRPNAMDVKYDARLALGDWTDSAWYLPGYNDSAWQAATPKGPAYSDPYGDLFKRPIPQWTDYGHVDYLSLKIGDEFITLPYTNNTEETVTLSGRLPHNQQITPFMTVDSPAGKTIEIGMENPFNLIDAQYTTRDGIQSFETYSWMNGHFVEYQIPPGVEVQELKYRWTAYDEITGTFESNDPFFTRLWWMAANTLQICARDSFMDCPDRERGLWIGDVADQTGPVFYTLNEPSRLLLKKGIENTFAYQSGDIIQGLAPGFGDYRGKSSELCAQSLQYIEQGIWRYYFHTGDRETLAYAYPFIDRYLKLWKMEENGLPEERRGYARWVDWGLNPDHQPTHIAWYYMALNSAVKIARELGIEDNIPFYQERIKSIQENYTKVYWRDGYYGSEGKTKEERVSALTVLTGLASPDQYDALLENVLLSEYNASPHMEWIVLEAIMLTGNYEAGLERMRTRHEDQVRDPDLTTLYERYANDTRPRGTYNHAWNAPNYVLSHYIAGIVPEEVAWKTYSVRPNLAHLTHLKQIVPSVQGDITVDIEAVKKTYTLDLISPEGTTALIGIPKANVTPTTITANGQVIWKDGKAKKSKTKISHQGEDQKYHHFQVPPGTYKIIAK